MKFIDCHMHMEKKMVDLDEFLRNLDKAGVDEVAVFSFPPESHDEKAEPDCPVTPDERIALVKDWMSRSERIHGMFWIDPLDADALEQVDKAADAGLTGFKVICDHFYPDDERAMRVYEHIAEIGKPLHLHSGVLFSPHPSSKYNRPLNFEPLLEIPHLRFALAHVAWPWTDEYISVFGHWCYMREKGYSTAEMFIDTTPGTPPLYRENLLTTLFAYTPEVQSHIMLGIDNIWDYDVAKAREWVGRDQSIFDKLGLPQETRENYFYKNYLRFIGK